MDRPPGTNSCIPGDQKRVEILSNFQILDTPAEPVFDRLTKFASTICNTPIATITLIDENRQWFKSSVGLEISETDRDISFCIHTVRHRDTWVIEDTLRDPMFRENPFVTNPPFVRFYAGVPLITPDGFAIGSLAVMDRRPRRLSKARIETLKMLADQAMTHIELRRQRNDLNKALAARDEMNARLTRQAEHLREAQRIAKIGSWEMELSSRRLRLSEETYRIYGVDQHGDVTDFEAFMNSVHREDREHLRNAIDAASRGESPLSLAHRIVRPGGEVRHVHERGELRGTAPRQVLAGTVQDITEQHRAREKLELLNTCIARVNDSVVITEAEPVDEPGPRIVFVNRAFEERTGYTSAEVLGRSPRFLHGPDTQRSELDRIRRALLCKENVTAELINYGKNGKIFWIEIDIAAVAGEDGKISNYVSVQRDITQRKATERQIEQLAFFDSLTQLPNRRLLMDRLTHALDTANRKANCGALLFLDLDHFKGINDTLGHDKGDQLLEQVARRLERIIRRSNTVARIGGDEFVILLEDLSESLSGAATQAEIVAEKILACFGDAFHISGYEHRCTPSIGVTLFGPQNNNADELLKRADLAMYQAKADGRNAIRFFDQGMQSVVNARVSLDRDFRGSLQKGEFVLHYQPQVNDANEVLGAEALVRWMHPRRGLLYPSDFIALAEETGLIVHLGQWVLRAACVQLAAWQKEMDAPTRRVAVNVSARQFHHPDFLRRTLSVLAETGVNPCGVKLELTESAFVERFDETVEKMTELKKRGIRFSLDDFGTGYSSLSYLKKLPLDEIKIDRAFVRDILDDPDDAAITQTIVSLCQILGFDVVAEGVETEGQRAFLGQQGCRVYQGNLISPPVPAAML